MFPAFVVVRRSALGQLRRATAGCGGNLRLEPLAPEDPAASRRRAQFGDPPFVQRLPEQRAIGGVPLGRGRAEGGEHNVVGHHRVGGAVGVSAVARPRVVPGRGDHVRADGIELDVPIAGQQMAFALDRCRPEASFPQRARAPVGRVDVAYVADPEPLHQARWPIRGAGGQQEMDVVGHQDIGMNSTAMVLRRLGQQPPIAGVVGVAEEDRPNKSTTTPITRGLLDYFLKHLRGTQVGKTSE